MKILSIDTSSNICDVAVLEDTKLLKEISQNNGLTHSESLIPNIKNLLENLNIKLKDIDLIVCDKGPGSFTGIRIGIATAKGFSDSLNIPAIGISSLETLAYNIKEDCTICSMIDAKKSNAYYGIFKKNDNQYLLQQDLSVNSLSDILSILSRYNEPITFVGDGAINYKNIILDTLPHSQFVENNYLSAYNLGLIGFYNYKNNKICDLLPLYLRKPQAERMLEDKLKNGK